MQLHNFKENHSLVTDGNDDAFALDHVKYPSFLSDPDTTQYEVYIIDLSGHVHSDQTVLKLRGELRPRFVQIVNENRSLNL